MNISIFAKQPFRDKKDGHVVHVSSIIRGQQIASHIGARLNPEKNFKNDVCIYVEPSVPPEYDLKFEGKPYLDVMDGWNQLPTLTMHPDLTAIACSQRDYETLLEFISNDVILIPQHHCNFERIQRSRDEVITMGVIGNTTSFSHLPTGLKDRLAEKGIRLLEFSSFYTRQDVIDFYQKIDLQIIWRPYRKKLANPLKIINAASFGIPTIAFQEAYFKEMEGFYLPAKAVDEFWTQLELLKSTPALYSEYSQKCLKKAEEYHIDNIAKLYLNLAKS